MFTRLTRPEGKGPLVLNGNQAVVVFDAKDKTVVRTTATGENVSFVISEGAKDVVDRLTASGIKLVRVTRRSDNRILFINADQIVGVFERTGVTMIRTTAAGEHAEYTVLETISAIEKLLQPAEESQNSAAASPIKSLLRK